MIITTIRSRKRLVITNRSVVGTADGYWISTDLAIEALEKALRSQPVFPQGLILHSDQGSQFTSVKFITYCQEHWNHSEYE